MSISKNFGLNRSIKVTFKHSFSITKRRKMETTIDASTKERSLDILSISNDEPGQKSDLSPFTLGYPGVF